MSRTEISILDGAVDGAGDYLNKEAAKGWLKLSNGKWYRGWIRPLDSGSHKSVSRSISADGLTWPPALMVFRLPTSSKGEWPYVGKGSSAVVCLKAGNVFEGAVFDWHIRDRESNDLKKAYMTSKRGSHMIIGSPDAKKQRYLDLVLAVDVLDNDKPSWFRLRSELAAKLDRKEIGLDNDGF